MGLLDLYAPSIERGALQRAANPGPAPEPTFSTWATVESGAKGVPAGLLEGFGAVRDFSSGVDQRRAEEVAAREKRLGLAPTTPYVIPGGAAARKKADEFMPDPLTAHAAQQVVGGFSKSLTKAAAAMVVAGPTGGAALFGLAEADDTAQRLQDKGIDSSTAWQVGGVVGALSAVGARLPISGAAMAETVAGKVAATTALGVVGGPLSFMAQEGLSREILQRAGHADEAKLHDPTNPIGLAASMFPLAIGMGSLRGAIKRVGPLKTEAAAREAMALSPAEQAHSDAFERSAGNLAELEAAIKAEKRPEAKALLVAELEKQTKAAAGEVRGTAADRAAADPMAVDAARVAVVDEAVARSLPDAPGAHAEMLRAADMVGAGERVTVAPVPTTSLPEFKAWFADSKVVGEDGQPLVVYHGTARDFDAFDTSKAGSAIDAGKLGEGVYFSQDPRWSSNYANNAAKGDAGANVVPAHVSIQEPLVLSGAGSVWDKLRAVGEQWGIKSNPVMDEGNKPNPVWAKEFTAAAINAGHDGVILPGVKGQTEYVAFRPEQIKSAIGNSGKFDPTSASLTDPLQPGEVSPRQRAAASTLPEPSQVSLKPDPAPATPARAEGTPSPDAALAQKLAEQHPDMAVRLPGDEKSTTLAAALERIKAEQLDEAGLADLFQVAVQCALTGGAAI